MTADGDGHPHQGLPGCGTSLPECVRGDMETDTVAAGIGPGL